MSSSYGGPLASSEVIIQVSYSSKHRVARESLKINHFSVVTDEVVLALFCVVCVKQLFISVLVKVVIFEHVQDFTQLRNIQKFQIIASGQRN